MRHVPASVPKPPYAGVMAAEQYHGSHVQSPEIIEAMRFAGRIARTMLMLMMLVVTVPMFMLHRFMNVVMIVPLGQMQP